MKKLILFLLIIGIAFVSVGVYGYIATRLGDADTGYVDYKTDGYFGRGSGRPGCYIDNLEGSNSEPFGIDELSHEVQTFIERYDTNLVIGDIFIFEDTEYYYSIIEEDTGKGAMELLVNPYTKGIHPEYGPNMMWNLKYGMHNAGGMMGNRNMMGYSEDDEYFDYSDYSEDNEISSREAYNEGMSYLARSISDLTLGEAYHDFYGYYTFHVEKDGEPVGMLSVNGFTGAVWYHDWHGDLVEIIGGHEEDGH